VVGEFYATPVVPYAAVVTVVPRGLWREQPLAQWLLGEEGQGARSSFVASVPELRAQLREQYQQQVGVSEAAGCLAGEGWLGGVKPSLWKKPPVVGAFQRGAWPRVRSPWIEVQSAPFALSKFVRLVSQQFLDPQSLVYGSDTVKPPVAERGVGPEGLRLPTGMLGSKLKGVALVEYAAQSAKLTKVEQPVWWTGAHYGAQFEASQERLKALYWYEERLKMQLKVGGYAPPAPGVLFDEGRSGWWYARQYFQYRL
jgi:hypothetical protein